MSEKLKKNIGKLFAGDSKLKDILYTKEDIRSSVHESKMKRGKISSDDPREFVPLGKSQSYQEKHPLIGSEKLILHTLKNRLPSDTSEPRKELVGKLWGNSVSGLVQLNASVSSIGTPGLAVSQRPTNNSTSQISKNLLLTNKTSQKHINDGMQNRTEWEDKFPLTSAEKKTSPGNQGHSSGLLMIAQNQAQIKQLQGKESRELNRSLGLEKPYRSGTKSNVFQAPSNIQVKIQEFERQISHSKKTSHEAGLMVKDHAVNMVSTPELRELHSPGKQTQSRQLSQMNSSKAGSAELGVPEDLRTPKSRLGMEGQIESGSHSQHKPSGMRLADTNSGIVGTKPNSGSWLTDPDRRQQKLTHTRAGSSSPSPSVGSSHYLKGNNNELQYKWTVVGEKLESKVEKTFEKLFKELRDLKREVLVNLRAQIESGMQDIKKSSTDLDEISIEVLQISCFKDFTEAVKGMLKPEVYKIKIEQEKILEITEQVIDNSLHDGNVAEGTGDRKPVKRSHDGGQMQRKETSFTQFFENNKPDFIDCVDPETFFQTRQPVKRPAHLKVLGSIVNPGNSPANRQSIAITGSVEHAARENEAPSPPQASTTNYFEQSFKG